MPMEPKYQKDTEEHMHSDPRTTGHKGIYIDP